ncbi:protein cycle-like isoform X2 [Dysidea avara]|uniref:protein cycle-like isoform X2 n=1 Tax=Dysidea avara TaxID=196820 RepID=UPI0033300198
MSSFPQFNFPGGSVMSADSSGQPPPGKRQRLDKPLNMGGRMDGIFIDDDDSTKKAKSDLSKKQHCEVEKKRRDKMNYYMCELATMIPACSEVPRKLDKLSILKMAVEHMKRLRGDPYVSQNDKPGFLSDDELKRLLVEAASGFMLILCCSNGRILFASDTLQDVLGEAPDNWMGHCFYDILHPKDVQKVKEQLHCFNINDTLQSCNEQGLDSSTVVLHGQAMNGLRRSFLCRVKMGGMNGEAEYQGISDNQDNRDYTQAEELIRLYHSANQMTPGNQQYSVLHCSGFIRALTSSEKITLNVDEEGVTQCLVAIARLQPFSRQTEPEAAVVDSNDSEFVARVGLDGKFTYIDHRVVSVLGYVPQDLVGEVSYQYYHPDDLHRMVQLHQNAVKYRTPMPTIQYRFLSKKQDWVWLAAKAFAFVNPYSQQVEYIIFTNVLLSKAGVDPNTSSSTNGSEAVSMLPDSVGTPQQPAPQQQQPQQSVTAPSERVRTQPPSNPATNANMLLSNPTQPTSLFGAPPNMSNGHAMMSSAAMFPNGDASFGNMQPQLQMGNAAMLFGQIPGMLPGTSNQMVTGQADTSSQMFRPGLQQQQVDPMMGGSNKNFQQQEVILNLMKEYGNPEQIGSLFDQQMADPFNIQMQLPMMDYFD